MKQEKQAINNSQLSALIILFVIGDLLLFLPRTMAMISQQDCWIAALIGLPFGVALCWFLHSYSSRFPGMTLVGINAKVLGKFGGGVMTLLFLAPMFSTSIVQVHLISSFVTTQMLTETPDIIIDCLMLIVVAVSLRGGLLLIARSSEIFLPIFLFLIIALILMLLPEIQMRELLPIGGSKLIDIVKGALVFISFPFAEMFAFLMIFPKHQRNEHSLQSYILALLVAGLILVVIVLLSMLVLGAYVTEHHFFSTYILAKQISIGNFLQRVEALLAISFILSSFIRSALYGYAFLLGFAELLNLKDYRFMIGPFLLLGIGYSYVVAPNAVIFGEIAGYTFYWYLTYSPCLLLLILCIQKLRLHFSSSKSKA